MDEVQANEVIKKEPKGRPRVDVDTSRILKLYNDDKMSVRQVASVVGISHATVARRIAEKTGQLRAWRLPGEK